MQLQDKTVTVETMSVSFFPAETTVTVSISKEIVEGVFSEVGRYNIKFDRTFQTTTDPELLQLINEKLLLIPE